MIDLTKKDETLIKALKDFKSQYPNIDSGDLQTFIIGWQTAVKNLTITDVRKCYSIEDIERCVENWGICKVEKEYIVRFLNG